MTNMKKKPCRETTSVLKSFRWQREFARSTMNSLGEGPHVLLDVVGVEVPAQARSVLSQHALPLTRGQRVTRYLLYDQNINTHKYTQNNYYSIQKQLLFYRFFFT